MEKNFRKAEIPLFFPQEQRLTRELTCVTCHMMTKYLIVPGHIAVLCSMDTDNSESLRGRAEGGVVKKGTSVILSIIKIN